MMISLRRYSALVVMIAPMLFATAAVGIGDSSQDRRPLSVAEKIDSLYFGHPGPAFVWIRRKAQTVGQMPRPRFHLPHLAPFGMYLIRLRWLRIPDWVESAGNPRTSPRFVRHDNPDRTYLDRWLKSFGPQPGTRLVQIDEAALRAHFPRSNFYLAKRRRQTPSFIGEGSPFLRSDHVRLAVVNQGTGELTSFDFGTDNAMLLGTRIAAAAWDL